MNMFAILFLLILATNGCGGQDIELNILPRSELCQEGFRADTDIYNITGTVGPNYTTFISAGWIPTVSIQVLPVGATQFKPICSIRIGDKAQFCSPTAGLCYCENTSTTPGTIPIRVISPTIVGNSHGTVRGEWQHRNTSKYFSTKNITLPAIYDVNAADLTLFVNNVQADNTSESCGVRFKDNDMNTIKLCCSNAATPCNPRLAFNGTVVTKNQSSPCVEYMFTANATVNVTMSYSMCTLTLTDYITRGFCVIESSVSSTTEHTTNSEHGTDNITVTPTSSSATVTGTDNITVTPTSSSATVTGTDNITVSPTSSSATVTGTGTGTGTTVKPTNSSSTDTGTGTTVKPTNSSSTDTGTPEKDNTDLIIGLVVGLGLLLIILAIIALIIWCYKKKKSGALEPQNDNNTITADGTDNLAMTKTENINGDQNIQPPQQGPAKIATAGIMALNL